MKKLSHFLKTPQGKTIGALIALVVLLFAYYFYRMSTNPPVAVQVLEVDQTDHVRGAAGAKVTVVEFGDFQCPACAAYESLVRQVTKDNSGIVQVVFRHFPLTQIHQNALLAAKASEAAALQGKFWEMHDMLYDNQKAWSEGTDARSMIIGYAATLGLNIKQFSQDIDSPAVEAKILAEYKEGVKLGVQGTPTFFINGKKLSDNPKSVEAFNALIQAAAK
jgi:protein-disulfide isomerase